MVFFIRNKTNETIIDLEIYKTKENDKDFLEAHYSIDIVTYTNMLLSLNEEKAYKFVNVISNLNDIRKHLWEFSFVNDNYTEEKADKYIEELRQSMMKICKKFDLTFVQD